MTTQTPKKRRGRPTLAQQQINNTPSWSFDPRANLERPDLSKKFPVVAVYKRISSLADDSVTFERQHMEVMQMLKRDYDLDPETGNCKIVVFEEEGSAYKNKKRPQFDKMIDAIDNGEFTHLAAYELARLFRNTNVSGRVTPVFERTGIKLCIKQLGSSFDLSRMEGQMSWQMFALFAQQYAVAIQESTRGSQTIRAQAGLKRGGYDPLGLRTVKSTETGLSGERSVYAIDDDPQPDYPNQMSKAALVREMYRRASEGHAPAAITKWLNRSGFPLPQGGELWTQGHITRILKNPIYIGVGHHKGAMNLDASGKPKITHEVLIDPVLYETVGSILRARNIKPAKRPKSSPLSGILLCTQCNQRLLSCSSTSHGKPLRTFRCNTPLLGGKCGGNLVAAVGLEDTVYDIIVSILSDPDMNAKLSTIVRDVKEPEKSPSEIALEADIDFYTSRVESEDDDRIKKSLLESLATAEAQLVQLRAKAAVEYAYARNAQIPTVDMFKEAWADEDKLRVQYFVQSLFKTIEINKSAQKHNHHYYRKLGWKMDVERVTLVFHDGTKLAIKDLYAQNKVAQAA
jgi:DNA invertase Pin-like site-specific DNA recombinase